MLDPYVWSTYPVHPRYTLEGATWHLTKELADNLDAHMLKYGNADNFSQKMYSRNFREYEERVINYSSCEGSTKGKAKSTKTTFPFTIGSKNSLLMARHWGHSIKGQSSPPLPIQTFATSNNTSWKVKAWHAPKFLLLTGLLPILCAKLDKQGWLSR